MYKLTIWLSKMAVANTAWIIFTLLGFGVFGVFPSTVSLLVVTKKIKDGSLKTSIFKEFFINYVDNFLKVNLYGYIILLANIVIFGLMYVSKSVSVYLFMVAIAVFILTTLISLLVFPVFVYFDADLINTIRLAAIVALGYPSISFILITLLMVIYTIVFETSLVLLFPFLFLFFLFSSSAYLIHVLFKRVVDKFDIQQDAVYL